MQVVRMAALRKGKAALQLPDEGPEADPDCGLLGEVTRRRGTIDDVCRATCHCLRCRPPGSDKPGMTQQRRPLEQRYRGIQTFLNSFAHLSSEPMDHGNTEIPNRRPDESEMDDALAHGAMEEQNRRQAIYAIVAFVEGI